MNRNAIPEAAPGRSAPGPHAAALIDYVFEVYELLLKEADLSPANPVVTDRIGRLSGYLRLPYASEAVHAVLHNERIRAIQRSLRDKLSEAEFLKELRDSRRLCESDDAGLRMLDRLPYRKIYEALVREELSLMFQLTGPQSISAPIVFVGSGPIPLSAVLLHLYTDAPVVCLEFDPEAYALARLLLQRIGLNDKITVVPQDGAAFDYGSFRSVYVASLVKNKFPVLERIDRTGSDAMVAMRTSEGMRQLMYEAVDETRLLRQGWRVLARTSPDHNLVINSTLFLDRMHR